MPKSTYKTFEDWWYELEGFGLRAERASEEIDCGDEEVFEKWLRTAWVEGAKAGIPRAEPSNRPDPFKPRRRKLREDDTRR